MNRLIFTVLILSFATPVYAGPKNYQKKIAALIPNLKGQILRQTVVVESVKVQNKKKMSMEVIQSIDLEWKKTAGISAIMKTYLFNDCAKKLREIQSNFKYIAEIFVMDNQGAIVCETDITSDFWQGDEDKWKKSFLNGGADFIDKPKFDESTQAYLVQVSLPIFEDQKRKLKPVGAVTIGIDLDELE